MNILKGVTLSLSEYAEEIDVDIAEIDIADWLFSLPEAEYRRCCAPDHITGLVIQHYVAEEATPAYCRMNSISDDFTPLGRTQVNVVWELIAEAVGDGRTRYTNRVTSHPTDVFMAFLAAHGQTFEAAAAARQEAGGDHNRREAPLFAASIARRAKANADRR